MSVMRIVASFFCWVSARHWQRGRGPLAAAAALLAWVGWFSVAEAGTIFASGAGRAPGQQDANWQIVALPTGAGVASTPQPAPYFAYVASSVPNVWVGGTSNAGAGGGRWITPGFSSFNNSPTASAFPFGNWQPYSWVARQAFTIPEDGIYQFNFFGSGDDYMRFFVGGNVQNVPPNASYADKAANFPTVVGGTQVMSAKPNETVTPPGQPFGPDGQATFSTGAGTSGIGAFGALTQFTGSMFLTAGTHYAYMVLSDTGGDSGAIIGESTFAAVPEPSMVVLVGMGVAGMLVVGRRRTSGRAGSAARASAACGSD